MPRKAKKDVEEIEVKKNTGKKINLTSTAKNATTKKATEKKVKSEKNSIEKTITKKSTTKKTTEKKSSLKKPVNKKATTNKSVTVEKASSKVNIPSSTTNTAKTASKKSEKSSRKTKKISVPSLATRRKSKNLKFTDIVESDKNKFANILEYYDLPYRYNETVVKILAQTPKVLFVYWDISDGDRKKFEDKYGKYFFNDTYPVLIIHNKSLNYYQEVEINDFANSWYISIPDSRSKYNVELARRFKEYVRRNPDMPHKEDIDSIISITYSNDLVMPNDHVLLDEIKPKVKFRNVKTNEEYYKDTKQILANNKLIDFYKLYKEIYRVENLTSIFSLSNPSSGNPTSTFK